MTKRKQVTISVDPWEYQTMELLENQLNMGRSEIIRYLLEICSTNAKLMDLVEREKIYQKDRRKLINQLTSRNAQYVKEKQDVVSWEMDTTSLPINNTNIPYIDKHQQELKHLYEIARTRWLEE